MQSLRRRIVHMLGRNGRHHSQPAHGVQAGADHAAMNALVGRMSDQIRSHGDMPLHQRGRDLADLQTDRLIEGHARFKDLAQAGDELRLELHGLGSLLR
jgi:hypothetical protein